MAHVAGRGHSRVVSAGGERHGEKHMQWARGMQGVCEDRYGGEGEYEAHWCTWVCVSLSFRAAALGTEPTALGTEPAVREGSTSIESDVLAGTESEADQQVAMWQKEDMMLREV